MTRHSRARSPQYEPYKTFQPSGRAYTTYLKHTGQLHEEKVEIPEISKEERMRKIIERRRQWELVLHQLG